MAKKKTEINAKDEQAEPGEQGEMFPELNVADPAQKALLAAAKKYAKDKAQRDELLSTSKEKVDASMQQLIAAMHECKIRHFKHKGVEAELITISEKVAVRIGAKTTTRAKVTKGGST